jgi:MerR family transcriptional regulator, redox-sensitive transcriptional activator SoxR
MTVGELAKRAGLRPSAVRYYERLGLLPAPPRRSGRRDYGPEAFNRLAVVLVARECGFTLAETLQLIDGFAPKTAASARWNALADSKEREMDTLIARAQTMKDLLQRIRGCRCETLAECGQRLRRHVAKDI